MTINTVSDQSILDRQNATAIVDNEDRLVRADELITTLHTSNGGTPNGPLALTALSRIIHLARQLQIKISRRILMKNDNINYDLWVEASPEEDGTVLIKIIGGEPLSQKDCQETVPQFESQFVQNEAPSFQEELNSCRLSDSIKGETKDWKWEVDAELNLAYFSTPFANQIGIDLTLYLKKPFARLFKFETNAEGHFPIMEALANRRDFCAQPAKITSAGPSVWLSGRPIFDSSQRFKGFEGNVTVVSSTQAHQQTPGKESNNKITLQLPNRIDYSFEPPLHRIIENAERIFYQHDGYLHSNYVRYASDVTAASQHLMMLIDDLADLQEMENTGFRIELQPVDLEDLAKQAISLHSWKIQSQDIKIDIPQSQENVIAHADGRRVMQILLNLISNALRYSPPKSSIWIRVEQDQNKAYITIADQGKGIASVDQQRIFEKFERLNPQESSGAGLGLFISRELARAMQGDIIVDSAPGQGARFTLTLPLF